MSTSSFVVTHVRVATDRPFTEVVGDFEGRLGRYDPGTRRWREWRLPGDSSSPYAVYVDERDVVRLDRPRPALGGSPLGLDTLDRRGRWGRDHLAGG